MTDYAPIHDADSAWHFGFECQWMEWFRGGMNWRNFDVVVFRIESGAYKGGYIELDLSLLGFCMTVEWCDRLSRSAFMAEHEQMICEVREMLREEKGDG